MKGLLKHYKVTVYCPERVLLKGMMKHYTLTVYVCVRQTYEQERERERERVHVVKTSSEDIQDLHIPSYGIKKTIYGIFKMP